MKKPRRAVAIRRASTPKTGTDKRKCGQPAAIHAPSPKPGNSTKRIVHRLPTLSAMSRTPSRRTPRKTKNAEPLENNPAKSYKPSSDADKSDLETSHKC